jgi:glutaminyl-peptide cyclotransferase
MPKQRFHLVSVLFLDTFEKYFQDKAMKKTAFLLIAIGLFQITACNNEETTQQTTTTDTPAKTVMNAPAFDAENAYKLIETQVAFGPRVPGTIAQTKCAAWIESEIKKYADTVYIQKTTVTQPISNKKYPCINIIGSINPAATQRVLLLAHWDSRPWADQDTKDQNKPIDAADDGGSGVAVMLEMAAKLKQQKPTIGVDFLFTDAEDVGKTEWEDEKSGITSYCLGTTYWAKNPHVENYTAKFGICLDMVGAKGALFPLEANSKEYAGEAQKKIWDIANRIGYSSYFTFQQGGPITDDHMEVIKYRNIPTVDIINLQYTGFGTHWHTHNDNIQIIDKNTLKAVGQTVLQTLYEVE